MAFMQIWRASPKFRIGLIITFLLVAAALLHGPLTKLAIGDVDPLANGSFGIFENPSRDHLLGTDRYGRDVLGLVFVGLPNSLGTAAIGGAISTLIGVVVGFVAGYKGGVVDAVLRTFTDMMLVIPTLPLLFILARYVRHLTIPTLALILAAFSWPFSARVIRSQVLSLRERPYVELSKITNLSDREIIVQDILPNMLPYIGIGFAISSVGAAFALVGLTILGLGPSDTIDLGAIIYFAQSWGVLSLHKYAILFAPITLLVLLFLGVALIQIGMEEFYNPRLRGAGR
ncbi:MAG TPA: ABC transporter permease [Thermomicrobiales bacterium]|jgi:peptide/nickel transport system permease protein